MHRRRSKTERYPDGWVPIQLPEDIVDSYIAWRNCQEPNVGWCLLCNQPIPAQEDLLPGTNSQLRGSSCVTEADRLRSEWRFQ